MICWMLERHIFLPVILLRHLVQSNHKNTKIFRTKLKLQFLEVVAACALNLNDILMDFFAWVEGLVILVFVFSQKSKFWRTNFVRCSKTFHLDLCLMSLIIKHQILSLQFQLTWVVKSLPGFYQCVSLFSQARAELIYGVLQIC